LPGFTLRKVFIWLLILAIKKQYFFEPFLGLELYRKCTIPLLFPPGM
jgi:hypothetical protein